MILSTFTLYSHNLISLSSAFFFPVGFSSWCLFSCNVWWIFNVSHWFCFIYLFIFCKHIYKHSLRATIKLCFPRNVCMSFLQVPKVIGKYLLLLVIKLIQDFFFFFWMISYGRLSDDPWRCQYLNPWKLWICFLISGKRDFENVIELRILR